MRQSEPLRTIDRKNEIRDMQAGRYMLGHMQLILTVQSVHAQNQEGLSGKYNFLPESTYNPIESGLLFSSE